MHKSMAFFFLITLASVSCAEVIFSSPGEIYRLIGSEPEEGKQLAYKFQVISTDRSSSEWAPMAFVGAIDTDSGSEFQVFIFQKAEDGDLVLGHRYVEGEELVFTKTLFHGVPLLLDIEIVISLHEDGLLVVEQPLAGAKHEYQTRIRSMRSFFGVAGAKAKVKLEE